MISPRTFACLLLLAPLGVLAACTPTTLVCVVPSAIVGGQARIPLAIAQAGSKEPFSREVAVAKGEVFLADAAGRALPGITVQTSASGGYLLNRVPPGQATMVAVRARAASGASVTLKGLARVGSQGATADVNVATTIATTALLEGQREVIGDFDQASYDKLVAKVYQRLDSLTALDLNDDAAMIAQFKRWMAEDAEMTALYDRLRAEVTSPRVSLADQIKALGQAQGLPTGGQLPPRPAATSPSPAPATQATAAPGATTSPSPDATPSATATPAVLAGDVTTIAGQDAGFTDGVGIAARFNAPGGLAFDPAAATPVLYVADTVNNRIRRIDLADPEIPVVTTIAGTGTAGARDGAGAQASFNRPIGLAFATDGELLVVDSLGPSVRRVNVHADDHPVSTILGPSARTPLVLPIGVTVDPTSGAVYVTDLGDHTLRRMIAGADAPIVSTLAGGSRADDTGFIEPAGVAKDPDGFLWVADSGKGLIRTVAPDGTVATFAGRYTAITPGDAAPFGYAEGSGAEAVFARPLGLARHPDGSLLVADSGNHRIRALWQGRSQLVAGSGNAGNADGRASAASFDTPSWVAVSPDGTVYVSDTGNHRIRRIS